MANGMVVSEAAAGMQRPPQTVDLTLKSRVGYCADCGTWDAHGRFCAACGYDFTPESESDIAAVL